MHQYSLQLLWAEEENAYIAMVPEIPELRVTAPTSGEAADKMADAVSAYLDEKNNRGETAPAPRRLEAFSGQFRLRIPRDLHAALVMEAEDQKISLNSYLVHILSRRHIQQQAPESPELLTNTQLRETIEYMHELVSNITITGTTQPPGFFWKNDESVITTRIQ